VPTAGQLVHAAAQTADGFTIFDGSSPRKR
jgi:hypothetical protein